MNVSENVENWNHDYILAILQILEELFNFDPRQVFIKKNNLLCSLTLYYCIYIYYIYMLVPSREFMALSTATTELAPKTRFLLEKT